VHLAVLWLCLNLMQLTFELSQATATGVAIIGNFTLTNWLTYHDRRLIVRGFLSFALICGFGAVANVASPACYSPSIMRSGGSRALLERP
jgi:putative flippase GtrA